MNLNILIGISCICILFVIGKIFIIPIKKVLKLIYDFEDVLIQVTENQYNNMIMFAGTKETEEDISIENLLIFE